MDFEFTRGDTFQFKFRIKDKNGEVLPLNQNAEIYFTVKKNRNSKNVLIQKRLNEGIEFRDGFYYVRIDADDTNSLSYGTYNYDIEFKQGNIVKTITLGQITLTDEITFKGDEINGI